VDIATSNTNRKSYQSINMSVIQSIFVTLPSVGVRSIAIFVPVCMSVCPLAYLKTTCSSSTKFSVHLSVTVARTSSDNNAILTSGFVDDVTFLYITLCMWAWHLELAILTWRRVAASSHKFPTYSSGGAMLFDFLVIYNDSKLRTGDEV